MSTVIWPALPTHQLPRARDDAIQRELEWLLTVIQDTLQSLKSGLEECSALLEPRETGSTLALSSQRSENLKGFITLNGTRITKGDIQLRLASLPPPRGQNSYRLAVSNAPTAPDLVIDQLVTVRTLINSCLDVVDATRWTGDAQNADYMSTQLRLLHENVREAKETMRGGEDGGVTWHEHPVDKRTFEPPLPRALNIHLSISDAALIFSVRTLEHAMDGSGTGASTPNSTSSQSYSGFSIRDRLAAALGAAPSPKHDEADKLFEYKGQTVRVKEKLRIETQDPSLIAALAKLNALEHTVALSRRALDTVMDRQDDTFKQ